MQFQFGSRCDLGWSLVVCVWHWQTSILGKGSGGIVCGWQLVDLGSILWCWTSVHSYNLKGSNGFYQLQCTECNAFYIGETRRSLSDHINGHWFTTTVSNPDLPVTIQTQSHQIPFQERWSVSVIHKLPDSTPDHIQFETAYQLVLQSWHTPGLNIFNPPHIPPSPQWHS